MGRKTIREDIRKKEAALKRAENMIKELKTAVNAKNHEINEARELLDNMTAEIITLRESLKTGKDALERKICENEKIGKQIEEKKEELKIIRSLVKEKDKNIEEFREALKNKEQDLEEDLSKKNLEIAHIKANLSATKNELQFIKDRTVWQQLTACFRNA
jgi:chromosome segregation ATPase